MDASLTKSQQRAYKAIMSGLNVFLTGHAGTGKSYLLNIVRHELSDAGKNVVVAAPTGIAAINVGGTTLHRLFELKPDIYSDRAERIPSVLKRTDVLIIDEISMCRIDLFDYIGRVLKKTHRFIQVIVVGDFCQLPPVIPNKGSNSEYFDEKGVLDTHFGFDVGGGFAFLSEQWTRLNFKTIILEEVVRQNDPQFIDALDRARRGKVEALEYFAFYSNPQVLPKGIYLAGRNAEVNRINANKLAAIGQRSYFYNAECKGEVREDDKRGATELLELKVGARIMTTANDSEYRNGDLGYITALTEDSITVLMDNAPKESEIKRYTWEIIRYQVEITDQDRVLFKRTVVGRYIQFPLKLAWAVTIHKSQGQTFDQVNLNPQCWDSGQLYVALSRVRSIEGLHLVSPLYDRYLKLDPAVSDFYEYACVDEPDDVGIARDMVYKNDALPKKKTAEETDGTDPNQYSLFGNC